MKRMMELGVFNHVNREFNKADRLDPNSAKNGLAKQKIQLFDSRQLSGSHRSSKLRHSSTQESSPSPDVDTDISVFNETLKEKADRLLQEANKRDIALMAASSRATTRYAALYAASQNRGLEASLEKHLTSLKARRKKALSIIMKMQEHVKDDFKKTKTISSRRRQKHSVKFKNDVDGKIKSSFGGGSCRDNKLPPINLRNMYGF